MREKTFNMRLGGDEWERLERLAKGRELNAAGLIRALLREEDERIKATRRGWETRRAKAGGAK